MLRGRPQSSSRRGTIRSVNIGKARAVARRARGCIFSVTFGHSRQGKRTALFNVGLRFRVVYQHRHARTSHTITWHMQHYTQRILSNALRCHSCPLSSAADERYIHAYANMLSTCELSTSCVTYLYVARTDITVEGRIAEHFSSPTT